MAYSFAEQLERGLSHEKTLDAYCSQWFDVRMASREEQRNGIDRTFVAFKTGEITRVEYKADTTASRTGNAFVETLSVDKTGKAGWAYSSQAEWLLYFLPKDRLIYFWEMALLRDHLPQWEKEFPKRVIPNQGYNSEGILVPLDEFERYARKVITF